MRNKSVNLKLKLKGQTLVEILVVFAISAVFLPALLTGLFTTREGKSQQKQKLEAIALLSESEEAVRSIRGKNWAGIATNGTYHPAVLINEWALTSGIEIINGFQRKIEVENVYRDSSGNISSNGSLDPSTKKITHTISWETPYSSSVSTTSYLTRFLENLYRLDTTEQDFLAGLQTGVTITNTDDGEILLGSGGFGEWCAPNLTATTLDLPKSGQANALSVIEGVAFAGTGENASGESFVKINLNNTNPPTANIAGTFSNYKTNDVYGEQNYGYIASDTNSKELIILDISQTPFTEIGYYNGSGSTNADDLFIKGNTGFITQGNYLRNFDLTSHSGSRPSVDSDGVQLAGTGTAVVVIGNYAYVSISGASIEMQIVDLSNPTNMVVVGQADVDGQGAKDIFVNETGTRAYIAAGQSASQQELFIIDITTKTGNRPVIGSYDTNGMNPRAITVVPGNRAIIVGDGAEEYQVINISSESNPVRCGGIEVSSGVRDLASVLESDGDAYSYIVTGDSASEFKIIVGGPGGNYSSAGEYESSIFDPGSESVFNRVDMSHVVPQNTTLRYQISVADQVNGSCTNSNYIYVGPDGTTSTYFTNSSALPLDDDGVGFENPGRCFRYKAYLTTTDTSMSPVVYSVGINYSP